MINANELRIGNKVISNRYGLDENGKPRIETVEMIDYDGINTEHYRDGCEPNHTFDQLSGIPLTSEVLERCGFDKRESGYKKPDYTGYDWTNESMDIAINDDGLYYDTAYHIIELETLHQLQNLHFSLFGTELEIR